MRATYLYTWNPRKWLWRGLRPAATKVESGIPKKDFWTCGGTKRIIKGDRFFLIRLGVAPKGIVGVGDITSEPYTADHWDDRKRQEGRAALGTDILFRRLSVDPLISLETLEKDFPDVHWTPQNSGLRVPDNVAQQIFSRIGGKVETLVSISESLVEEVVLLRRRGRITKPEGIFKPVTESITLERRRRDVAVASWAQEQANGRCELCQADAPFEDSMGYPFLEVHHILPLAEGGPDTPANVVALCPNCHRRCHHGRDREAVSSQLAEVVLRRGAGIQSAEIHI